MRQNYNISPPSTPVSQYGPVQLRPLEASWFEQQHLPQIPAYPTHEPLPPMPDYAPSVGMPAGLSNEALDQVAEAVDEAYRQAGWDELMTPADLGITPEEMQPVMSMAGGEDSSDLTNPSNFTGFFTRPVVTPATPVTPDSGRGSGQGGSDSGSGHGRGSGGGSGDDGQNGPENPSGDDENRREELQRQIDIILPTIIEDGAVSAGRVARTLGISGNRANEIISALRDRGVIDGHNKYIPREEHNLYGEDIYEPATPQPAQPSTPPRPTSEPSPAAPEVSLNDIADHYRVVKNKKAYTNRGMEVPTGAEGETVLLEDIDTGQIIAIRRDDQDAIKVINEEIERKFDNQPGQPEFAGLVHADQTPVPTRRNQMRGLIGGVHQYIFGTDTEDNTAASNAATPVAAPTMPATPPTPAAPHASPSEPESEPSILTPMTAQEIADQYTTDLVEITPNITLLEARSYVEACAALNVAVREQEDKTGMHFRGFGNYAYNEGGQVPADQVDAKLIEMNSAMNILKDHAQDATLAFFRDFNPNDPEAYERLKATVQNADFESNMLLVNEAYYQFNKTAYSQDIIHYAGTVLSQAGLKIEESNGDVKLQDSSGKTIITEKSRPELIPLIQDAGWAEFIVNNNLDAQIEADQGSYVVTCTMSGKTITESVSEPRGVYASLAKVSEEVKTAAQREEDEQAHIPAPLREILKDHNSLEGYSGADIKRALRRLHAPKDQYDALIAQVEDGDFVVVGPGLNFIRVEPARLSEGSYVDDMQQRIDYLAGTNRVTSPNATYDQDMHTLPARGQKRVGGFNGTDLTSEVLETIREEENPALGRMRDRWYYLRNGGGEHRSMLLRRKDSLNEDEARTRNGQASLAALGAVGVAAAALTAVGAMTGLFTPSEDNERSPQARPAATATQAPSASETPSPSPEKTTPEASPTPSESAKPSPSPSKTEESKTPTPSSTPSQLPETEKPEVPKTPRPVPPAEESREQTVRAGHEDLTFSKDGKTVTIKLRQGGTVSEGIRDAQKYMDAHDQNVDTTIGATYDAVDALNLKPGQDTSMPVGAEFTFKLEGGKLIPQK